MRLGGRKVLVVGGGTVATRRVPALLDAGAEVLLVAPEVTPALRALADAGRLHWESRAFEPSDVDGAWLVQAAVDDRLAAASVSAAAAERHVFCVRADDRVAAASRRAIRMLSRSVSPVTASNRSSSCFSRAKACTSGIAESTSPMRDAT